MLELFYESENNVNYLRVNLDSLISSVLLRIVSLTKLHNYLSMNRECCFLAKCLAINGTAFMTYSLKSGK